MMRIFEVSTGREVAVDITLTGKEDFRKLTRKRYAFNWKDIWKQAAVYKLQLPESDDILGVMAVVDIPQEQRMEIRLLANAREQIGKGKTYDGIAGCLIAFAGRLSRRQYAEMACISLIPKTVLVSHYVKKYGMVYVGWQVVLTGAALENLIKKYGA